MYEYMAWRISKGISAKRLFRSFIGSGVGPTCFVLELTACCIATTLRVAEDVDGYGTVK
jgi:hypothetical protein